MPTMHLFYTYILAANLKSVLTFISRHFGKLTNLLARFRKITEIICVALGISEEIFYMLNKPKLCLKLGCCVRKVP